jgi:hypothetical protein
MPKNEQQEGAFLMICRLKGEKNWASAERGTKRVGR